MGLNKPNKVGNQFLLENSIFESVVVNGHLRLKEIASAPVAVAGFGDYYTKPDNENYFQSGAGIEHKNVTSEAAEMYIHDPTDTTISVINTTLQDYAMKDFTAGPLTKFSFLSSATGTINASADNGSSILRVTTDSAHGRTTGDIVTINDMAETDHNGITSITVIDSTNFDCDNIPFVAATAETAEWNKPSAFKALDGAEGNFHVNLSIISTPSNTNETFLHKIVVNKTIQIKGQATQRRFSVDDVGGVPLNGTIENIVKDDIIWLLIQNTENTGNLINRYVSFNITKT